MEEWTKIGGTPLVGLTSVGTEGSLQGTEIVSMNVWGFPTSVLSFLEEEFTNFLEGLKPHDLASEFYLPAAVDASIRNGLSKVRVYSAACSWMGVTYKEDKSRVVESIAELVDKGEYKTPLFS